MIQYYYNDDDDDGTIHNAKPLNLTNINITTIPTTITTETNNVKMGEYL